MDTQGAYKTCSMMCSMTRGLAVLKVLAFKSKFLTKILEQRKK